MKTSTPEPETWLDLSKAADFLGVHFTTLRRWADHGEIPCIRTPGKRRRFSVKALSDFLQASTQPAAAPGHQPLQELAIDRARQQVQALQSQPNISGAGGWLARMDPQQRLYLKGSGHRLMALLLQYNSRCDSGEIYLDEGQRLMQEYSRACAQVGLSLPETVNVFLLFRRSILDAVHETGYLGGADDQEGRCLYQRTTEFLDALLLDLISSYPQANS